jgi:hypothetical protein
MIRETDRFPPVFAGFYRFEILFQPADDRPDRTGLKIKPVEPDRLKKIRPVTTLQCMQLFEYNYHVRYTDINAFKCINIALNSTGNHGSYLNTHVANRCIIM